MKFKILITLTVLALTTLTFQPKSAKAVVAAENQCSQEVTNQCANEAVDAYNTCMGIFGNTTMCASTDHNAACSCTQRNQCQSYWVCNDN